MRTALQQSFWDRMGGVVTLQRPVYEAIPNDPEATGQGWLIVLLLGLANGIAFISTPLTSDFLVTLEELDVDTAAITAFLPADATAQRLLALALGMVSAVFSWYLTSWLLRFIGIRLSAKTGQEITPEQMRRLVAWGYAPSLASFLAPIPFFGPLLATLGSLWALVTGVMVVRTAFDVGIGRAILIEILEILIILVVATALITAALVVLFGA